MNASERDFVYQTDTGPVIMPDFSRDPDDLIVGLELAFIAFNSPDWAEFVVRVPTSVGEGIEVNHYSKFVRYDTQNQVVRVSRKAHIQEKGGIEDGKLKARALDVLCRPNVPGCCVQTTLSDLP